MSLISVETYEHLASENVAVSYKVIKFCGIPLYSAKMESSNYNCVGQFNSVNFTSNTEESNSNLYTKTNIGFKNDKENKETAIQPKGIFRKS